jgi:hypothetical protein
MAITEKQPPKIDLKKCRAYLEQLQTNEYITQIYSGKINPDDKDQRPDFDESIKQLVLLAEKQAQKTGSVHVVINSIDAIRETPIGKQIFAESSGSKNQEQKSKAKVEDVKDNKQIMPPLPEGVTLPPVTYPLRDAYVQYSRAVSPEGYEDFHHTCFWAMCSKVAARRVAVNLSRIQYTPLIVVLAARTSLYKKTSTAEVEREILKKAGLSSLIAPAKTTPSRLLTRMSGIIPDGYANKKSEEKDQIERQLAMSGQQGWIYNEFGKLIKAMSQGTGPMVDFAELLLQFDDCLDKLDSDTQIRGLENVENPYLAITATMTPVSVRKYLRAGSEMWGDGGMARYIFSCPQSDTGIDSAFTRGQVLIPQDLIISLQKWHQRLKIPEIILEPIRDSNEEPTGKYEKVWIKPLETTFYNVSDEAYAAWKQYRSALKSLTRKLETEDLDGSYERLSTMALRVAALAASFEGSPDIQIRHWQIAQEQAERWRESLHQFYNQVNKSVEHNGPTIDERIIDIIEKLTDKHPKKQGPTCTQIARYMHMDAKKVEPNLRTLVKLKVLKSTDGRQSPYYTVQENESDEN